MRRLFLPLVLVAQLSAFGVTNAAWFPRLQPLFAGFDESRVPVAERCNLARAKVDFECARHNGAPRYAVLEASNQDDPSRKTFHGRGYDLTIVHDRSVHAQLDGPAIVLGSRITGGKPFRYSEVDEVTE